MDFAYCDKCGGVVEGTTVDAGLTTPGNTLCEACRTGQPAVKSDVLDEDFSLQGMANENLDMFSTDTIAKRKTTRTTKLEIVDDAAPDWNPDDNRREASAARTNPDDERTVLDPPTAPTDAGAFDETLRLTAENAAREPAPSAHTATATAPGPVPTAPVDAPATRWTLSCLGCQSQLSLKAVAKRSGLRCPKCSESMIVTPQGELLPRHPGPAVGERVANYDAAPPVPPPWQVDDAAPAAAPSAPPHSGQAPSAAAPPAPEPAREATEQDDSDGLDAMQLQELLDGVGSSIADEFMDDDFDEKDAFDDEADADETSVTPLREPRQVRPTPLPAPIQERASTLALFGVAATLIVAMAPIAFGAFLASGESLGRVSESLDDDVLAQFGEQARAAVHWLLSR